MGQIQLLPVSIYEIDRNTATSIHLHMVYSDFHATVEELSGSDRDHMSLKALNIHHLAPFRKKKKSLPTFALTWWSLLQNCYHNAPISGNYNEGTSVNPSHFFSLTSSVLWSISWSLNISINGYYVLLKFENNKHQQSVSQILKVFPFNWECWVLWWINRTPSRFHKL